MVILDGHKLRVLRKSHNLTQAQLAEAAGTTDRYVRDLESGRKENPSASIVQGFASTLVVPVEELMIHKEAN